MSAMKEQTYIKTKAPAILRSDAFYDDDEVYNRKKARKEAKDTRQKQRQTDRRNKYCSRFEGE